jgi:hypothetical protein
MSPNEYRFVRQFVWLASKSRLRRANDFPEFPSEERGATLCHMTVFPSALELQHVFTAPNPTVLASVFRCALTTPSNKKNTQ